jgi:2-amino-4-hydroxy-6-hydroxymethyldihydropteridine diphosphokinase
MAVRGLMEASFHVHKLSAIYETEPHEIESDTCFLNMAAEIHVASVSATQMMARLLRIEYLLGRKFKNLKKPRTVDIDILFFGDMRMETDFLTLPHPRLHERKFVLCPLAEIAPDLIHPVLHKRISDLLAACTDVCDAKRWNPNTRLPQELAQSS